MPPRQGPESTGHEKTAGGANLVTMSQAQGASSESFPVLQAFQEYIEAERKQARKRILQLSISFGVIIGVIVVGFLAAGVYMMQNTTNRLFEVAMSKKDEASPAPVAVTLPAQPQSQAVAAPVSPALEASIKQMSEVLAKMQAENLHKPAVTVLDSRPKDASSPRNSELDALKAELLDMKEQSRKLEGQLSSIRKNEIAPPLIVPTERPRRARYSVEDALAIARKTGADKAASDKAAADKIAAEKAKAVAATEKAKLAQIEMDTKRALAISATSVKAERNAQVKRESQQTARVKSVAANEEKLAEQGFPVANKVPPVMPQGVKVPAPLKDMMVISIPLKTKKGDVLPWRIFIPE